MKIIQLLPTMSFGDAVSNDTLAIRRMIREMGIETEIYAENIDYRLPAGCVKQTGEMPELTGEDLLIYPGHRYQSPVQLTGPYLEDARFITRGILAGEIRGREDTYRLGGRELHCRVAAHGLMGAYSFDPENL